MEQDIIYLNIRKLEGFLMAKKVLNEIEVYEKKRKIKLTIFPLLVIIITPIILIAASRMTTLSDRMNVKLPHTMTLYRTRDNRSREVFDQTAVKDITRKLNMMPKEKVYDHSSVFIDYENAYFLYLVFEDEYGYDYNEEYLISGTYMRVNKDGVIELYKLKSKDDVDELIRYVNTILRPRRNQGAWPQN